MITYIYTITVAIMVLAVLIFVHELGHFLVAKWCKVGVTEFAIGFGRKLFSRQYGETTYSIRAFPLGGFVKMLGDDPTKLDEAREIQNVTLENENDAEIEKPVPIDNELLGSDPDRWFLGKSLWARSAIVIAGPAFNLIFALLLSILMVMIYGKATLVDEPVIGNVIPGYPAEQAGLLSNDRVLSINGVEMSSWFQLADFIRESGGSEMELLIERYEEGVGAGTTTISITGQPDDSEMAVIEGRPVAVDSYRVGIVPSSTREPATVGESFYLGSERIVVISGMIVRGIAGMIQGLISTRHLGGPILIFQETSRSAQQGLQSLATFVIYLSISLAILNLLPIPVLDGGHLMFFLIEAIKGSPVGLKSQLVAQQVGMALLLLLMVYALGNDILRSFGI